MKIGIFGGTFNPIHFGHIFIAEYMADYMNLDKVIFIPSGIPPHKENFVDKSHRAKMVELSIEGNDKFEMSDYEISKVGKSYTFDTVTYFMENNQECEFYYIIGQDAILLLDKWYKYKALMKIVKFLVVTRGQDVKSQIEEKYGNSEHITFIDTPSIEISSTQIRRRVKENRSVKYFVKDEVNKYIEDNSLYKL